MFSKLKNYRKLKLKNKTKDNILKVVCLALLLVVWIVAAVFVINSRANAAQSRNVTKKNYLEASVYSSINTRSKQSKLTESEDETESEDAGVIPGDTDNNEGTEKDEEKVDDNVDNPVSVVLGGYGGAPSDVPDEALNKPDKEDAPLIKGQEVVDQETETVEQTESAEKQEEVTQKTETVEQTEPVEKQEEALQETEAMEQTEPAEKQISDYPYDKNQAVALAQLMWAEARGCSMREQSLVAWTVLNRVDVCYDGKTDFWSILTASDQFAYHTSNPYEEYQYRIAVDVLQRWAAEKDGVEDVGRTLPPGYLYYWGDGAHNYFGANGFSNELWFGLGDPYESWET